LTDESIEKRKPKVAAGANDCYRSSIFPIRPTPLNANQIRFRVLSTETFLTIDPPVGIFIDSVFDVFRSNAMMFPVPASS
jgi:hypothetical protein